MARARIRSPRVRAALLAPLLAAALVPLPAWAQGFGSPPPAGPPRGQLIPRLSESLLRAAESVAPAVVSIRTLDRPPRGALPPGRDPVRVGAGFVIHVNGLRAYVVTANHVVGDAGSVLVTLGDGRTLPVTLVARDPGADLAVLRVDAPGLVTIPLAAEGRLRGGELLMSVSPNPAGDLTVTVGTLGRPGRRGPGPDDDLLPLDFAIPPETSGSPVLNRRGEAVGVATARSRRPGGAAGAAIPAEHARVLLQRELPRGRQAGGAWLGILTQRLTPELARRFGLNSTQGALVSSVENGSPAARAGVRAGDVIVGWDGRPVDTPETLAALVTQTPVGHAVDLSVVREGTPRTIRATVGSRGGAAATPPLPGSGGQLQTALTIELQGRGPRDVERYTLTCDPAGGTLPDASAVCERLAEADDVFASVPPSTICTQVYGGPELAFVRGVREGRGVDAAFHRRNGCEIARYDRLMRLLGR